MNRSYLFFVALTCSPLLSFACGKNDPAPPVTEIDTGTVDADGGTSDGRVDTATLDGTSDSTVPDGSGDTDGDVAAKPSCAKGYVDGPGTAVNYPGRGTTNERLAAITWDELTMAWTTNVGGKIEVHYSDRADKDASFTTEQVLPDSLGPFGEDKVAFGADGLTMLFVTADHKSLRQVKRTARGTAFDATTPDATPFARLTGAGGEGGPTKQLTDVVLSKDGKWLFYTDVLRTTGASMMLSIRLSDGTFDYPNPLPEDRLIVVAGKYRRRPSGLSAETLSLFYYDESVENSFLAFHAPGTAAFSEFYAFAPSGSRAMPTEACNRVYLTITTAPDKGDGGVPTDVAPDGGKSTTAIFHAP